MQPRTKFQKRIVALSSKLPNINQSQIDYFHKECLEHRGVRLKSGKTTCLDCAYEWNCNTEGLWHEGKNMGNCPSCKIKITIEDTRKKKIEDEAYGQIIETIGGFQVIRSFRVRGYFKSGDKPSRFIREVSRIFLSPEGKYEIIGQYCQASYYGESWAGEFSLKESHTINRGHNMVVHKIYPKIKVIKELKRNGYKRSFYKMTPFTLFRALLLSNRSETLLKAKRYGLLNTAYTESYGNLSTSKIDKRWDSIKICLRNNYQIEESDIWFDYLDLLDFFGKDLKNPKYVCPSDLHLAHNKYLQKKNVRIRKQKLEELKDDIKNSEEQYSLDKGKYFGFRVEEGDYSIEVLQSVKEFYLEGSDLHHCIFTNAYYERIESLVLTAKYLGIRTETVEIHLNKMQIVQARGLNNKSTKHHDKILELVNSRMDELKSIYHKDFKMSA